MSYSEEIRRLVMDALEDEGFSDAQIITLAQRPKLLRDVRLVVVGEAKIVPIEDNPESAKASRPGWRAASAENRRKKDETQEINRFSDFFDEQ